MIDLVVVIAVESVGMAAESDAEAAAEMTVDMTAADTADGDGDLPIESFDS